MLSRLAAAFCSSTEWAVLVEKKRFIAVTVSGESACGGAAWPLSECFFADKGKINKVLCCSDTRNCFTCLQPFNGQPVIPRRDGYHITGWVLTFVPQDNSSSCSDWHLYCPVSFHEPNGTLKDTESDHSSSSKVAAGTFFLWITGWLSYWLAKGSPTNADPPPINRLKPKRSPLYLKAQSVQRSKHFSFRL